MADKDPEPKIEDILAAVRAGKVEVKAAPEEIKLQDVERYILGEITFAELIGLTQVEAEALADIGLGLYREGRYHDARKVFEGILAANPMDPLTHLLAGAVYQQLDLRDAAIERYTSVVTLDPNNLRGYLNRANMYFTEKRVEDGLRDLQRILELDPKLDSDEGKQAKAVVDAALGAD